MRRVSYRDGLETSFVAPPGPGRALGEVAAVSVLAVLGIGLGLVTWRTIAGGSLMQGFVAAGLAYFVCGFAWVKAIDAFDTLAASRDGRAVGPRLSSSAVEIQRRDGSLEVIARERVERIDVDATSLRIRVEVAGETTREYDLPNGEDPRHAQDRCDDWLRR